MLSGSMYNNNSKNNISFALTYKFQLINVNYGF